MIMFTMRILIIFASYDSALALPSRNLTEYEVVNLSKESFAAELEKMPHFVLFTHPPSSS